MLEMGVSPGENGLDVNGIIDGIEKGSIRALYLLGCNPLASFPDNRRIKKALEKLDLLIVQDILSSELTKMAHILLPASAAAEKSGTFTTPDGRVQSLQKAVNPPAEAREDIAILSDLIALYRGTTQQYTVADVAAEIAAVNPLYGSSASRAVAVASFAPATAPEAFSSDLTLLVGASLYHNGTSTLYSENNSTVAPEACIELHPADALRFGLLEGAAVTVKSAAASITAKMKISEHLQPGLAFAPYHSIGLNAASLLSGNANSIAISISKA
jgi:formate dehydrogenase alpha subunit